MTIIELLIALTLLGILLAVVPTAFTPVGSPRDDLASAIAHAHHIAVARATNVHVQRVVDGRTVDITAMADGRVLADSGVPVDMLSGGPRPGTHP